MPGTIIDAQIHLWERESPDRPWPDYGRAYAHGEELTAEQALARMDEAGVHRAVLVPPSWEGDRNDVCLAAARDYPDRFAVMGRFPIEDPSCRETLESWRETSGMLGVLDEAIFEQLPQVLDLARFANVAVKASCMPSLVSETYPYPTLQRAIRQVVEAFGPRRTFWGSDVSRLPCPLIDNVRLFTEGCPFLSDEDLDWIMGRAIAEWLEWR